MQRFSNSFGASPCFRGPASYSRQFRGEASLGRRPSPRASLRTVFRPRPTRLEWKGRKRLEEKELDIPCTGNHSILSSGNHADRHDCPGESACGYWTTQLILYEVPAIRQRRDDQAPVSVQTNRDQRPI